VSPPAGVRGDFDVLLDLAARLRRRGGGKRSGGRDVALRIARALGERRLLDLLLRFGPHRTSLRALAKRPHGIDFGALESRLPARLETPGKRLRVAPDLFLRDVPRLEASLSAGADDLVVIGRRQLRSNNSWMHNSPRLVKGPPECVVYLHPRDAEARGVRGGDRVVVRSRAGVVELPAVVTDDIRPGVISLPHGWGHARPDVALGVAAAHAGVSLNDLTDDQSVDALSGNASFTGVAVSVTRAASPGGTQAR
jgi:anaerobic selenocysteine-containing dehydrogenase